MGEQPITQSNYGDEDGDGTQGRIDPKDAALRGEITKLNIAERKGLPECIAATERKYMYLAINAAMRQCRGHEATLKWVPPISCGTQMRKSLEDRQVHENDDRRFRTVILRSQPNFAQRPAQDNVKMWIQEDAGRKMYFAKCVVFFKDGRGDHYVGLRWYAEPRIPPQGCLLELTGLNLAPESVTRSYSILPEACIVNGAVLIKCRGTFWAVQSPREQLAFALPH
jgi:hypothetical protein